MSSNSDSIYILTMASQKNTVKGPGSTTRCADMETYKISQLVGCHQYPLGRCVGLQTTPKV
jgi:hypothetical protein